jgi:hypothetical protein
MRIETVCVRLSRKVNLGNYESIDCEIFLTAKTDEMEDSAGVAEYLGLQAKTAINNILDGETATPPFVSVTKK